MGLVVKFGGKVLKNNMDIIKVARFIRDRINYNDGLVVVVGAMEGVTRNMLDEAVSISEDASELAMDFFLSTAEQATAAKLAMALQSEGLSAVPLNGYQLGIRTSSEHRNAHIESIDVTRIQSEIDRGNVVVATGFQGVSREGNITTFDECYGGSDLSAVLIAAALNWGCVLYKDVDGIYSVNPNIYARAKKLDTVDYREAIQLSSGGGSIVESCAVELAEKYNINLYVSDLRKDYETGTRIMHKEYDPQDNMISNIAINEDISVVTIRGNGNEEIVSELFSRMAEENISADIVIKDEFHKSNEWTMSVSFNGYDGDIFMNMVADDEKFSNLTFEIKEHLTSLSLIGLGMANSSGITGRMYNAIMQKRINMYHMSSSEISITITIDSADRMRAIVALCKEFDI